MERFTCILEDKQTVRSWGLRLDEFVEENVAWIKRSVSVVVLPYICTISFFSERREDGITQFRISVRNTRIACYSQQFLVSDVCDVCNARVQITNILQTTAFCDVVPCHTDVAEEQSRIVMMEKQIRSKGRWASTRPHGVTSQTTFLRH